MKAQDSIEKSTGDKIAEVGKAITSIFWSLVFVGFVIFMIFALWQ